MDPENCNGAPLGPSAGPAEGTVTICVFDETGAPLAGADVNVSGTSAGLSDDTGRVDVAVGGGSAIEVSSAGLVTHTLLGVTSRRFGVQLPRGSAPTRTVDGTLTNIAVLPRPPDGYRRVIKIRAGSLFTPLSLTEGLAIGAPADCTLAGDECTFSIEVDERVTHINATVVDTTAAFSDRLVAAFSISDAIVDGDVTFAIPSREGGLELIELDAGLDVVVAVPGARVGNDVILFGSPTATDVVPVPDSSVAPNNWLAVIYAGASDELHAGILLNPASPTTAPSALGVSIEGTSLRIPSERLATISLARGGEEIWRATVLDGRPMISMPSTDADQVAVLIHAGSTFSSDEGVLDRIEAVVTLPIVR